MNILLTGGAGDIDSHAAVVLSQAGHEIVLLDNFCYSNPSALDHLQKTSGIALYCNEAVVRDTDVFEKALLECKINAAINFVSHA